MIDATTIKEDAISQQTETARLPLRSDTTPRRLTLCKMCESQLRAANFFLKRVDVNMRGKTLASCGICHCRTYCGTFDVQGKREKDGSGRDGAERT